MRQSITQEFEYGCGVACYAFAVGQTYGEAAAALGKVQSNSNRFWVKDLREALNGAGLTYVSRHVKPHTRHKIYTEAAIVLIRRSKSYPTGHYLIRHEGYWMDPWINLPYEKDIRRARSGFRKRLPGKPMYVLLPVSSEEAFTKLLEI